MGAVHGVYLKYVGLSALSYAGYSMMIADEPTTTIRESGRFLADPYEDQKSLINMVPAMVMGYSTALNGTIAILFKMEWGMGLIGKDRKSGKIPFWSYVVFFPFHLPTMLYTHIHTRISRMKDANTGKSIIVPVASEVQPGWWVGGCYGHELGKEQWGGIIDLTVEFSETCRERTHHYLSAPTWDGVPLSPSDLEMVATFAVEARKDGDVLVHCAHGRGRSTTVMCACLVKAGMFASWEEAFEKGIKPNRNCCKLNKRMRENLAAWQAQYVDGKKST